VGAIKAGYIIFWVPGPSKAPICSLIREIKTVYHVASIESSRTGYFISTHRCNGRIPGGIGDISRTLLEREIDGHTNIMNENPLPELLNYILSCSCAMVLFLGSRAGMLALVGTIAVVIIIIPK
jgi:hypothetical protein